MTAIRVLVVEDNFYTRLGTVTFLRSQPEVEVVGEAAHGADALARFRELRPEVVLMDLRMPGMSGPETAAALCAHAPDARILVLTHHQGDEDVSRALRAGALGYLTKEAPGELLLTAILAVAAGQRFLPPEIIESMKQRTVSPELTRREREVLDLVADGASNREVAASLGISERTVELYVSSILNKLGARSRTEAVSIGVRRGLVVPGRAAEAAPPARPR